MAALHRRNATRWPVLLGALAASMTASCAGSAPGGASRPQPAVEVVGPWTGVEQQRFGAVLDRFRVQTGIQAHYSPAPDGVAVALDGRRTAGQVTDVAFLPQPGVLRQFAASGRLVPLEGATAAEIRSNYSPVWQRLGSVDGKIYGVWFKAADKSLVWYNIAAFERVGAIPSGTLDGLVALADRFRQSGIAPFAVGGADAWTLTDWFENLYLTMQGPERYQMLAGHRIPWTDHSVVQTLRTMGVLLQPGNVPGGTAGVLATTFTGSVAQAFAGVGGAAMLPEGDFVAGVITGTTSAQLGVDVDVFRFPPESPVSPWIIGGGDAAVLLTHSAGADRLVRYLSTPDAAGAWASRGGFVSPNLNLSVERYPDGITRSIALSVLDAGDSFLFDLSDLQPASFGSTKGQGMFAALQDFLVHRDPEATAARMEADASAAYSGR